MNGVTGEVAQGSSDVDRVVAAWVERGQSRPLERWIDQALDEEGVPRTLPVSEWLPCLGRLLDARGHRGTAWPESFDARIEGFVRAALRFSRPDGASVFGPEPASPEAGSVLRQWARRMSDAGLETVVNWWFPVRGKARGHAAPPLPAWSRKDRPLAVLRANWSTEGDFLALDHRRRGAACAFELFGLGRTWLGPGWASGRPGDAATPARPTCWISNSSADLAEWVFRAGDSRVVRSAALLRSRQIALLADQVEGPGADAEMHLDLPSHVTTEPIPESRALTLVAPGGRARARVFPIGLPRRPEGTERGSFTVEPGGLRLRQPAEGPRAWLPLVVSWAPERNRRTAHWRTLTVSEKSKPCPPGTAFAARLSWGRDETLVVYRSLARPALRAFLGHQTRVRFLIGLFSSEGKVEPILSVDE